MSQLATKKADVPIKDLLYYLLCIRTLPPRSGLALDEIGGAAGGALDVRGRRADRPSLWRGRGPAQRVRGRGEQHCDLFLLFRVAPAWAGARDQRPVPPWLAARGSPTCPSASPGLAHDSPGQMSDEFAELKARYDRLNVLYQVGSVIHSHARSARGAATDSESGRGFDARRPQLHRADQPDERPARNPRRANGPAGQRAGIQAAGRRGHHRLVARTGKPARVGDVRRTRATSCCDRRCARNWPCRWKSPARCAAY